MYVYMCIMYVFKSVYLFVYIYQYSLESVPKPAKKERVLSDKEKKKAAQRRK